MNARRVLLVAISVVSGLLLASACGQTTTRTVAAARVPGLVTIVGEARLFAAELMSPGYAKIRLTVSPDGRTALWFSRDRPGGPGSYDIWMSRRTSGGWSAAEPVSFNSPSRDFDPAFSPDGRFVYFCSDRPGGFGGDDVYRVAVEANGFGKPEHLDAAINSPANEFAPMLSPDGRQLLFASNRSGGAGGYDLYAAHRTNTGFLAAAPLAGAVNTAGDEFDATFLADSSTIIFARAVDLKSDRVDLYFAASKEGLYGPGTKLPVSVNDAAHDSYGPMLDWSRQDRFSFSAQRAGAVKTDLYVVKYRFSGD